MKEILITSSVLIAVILLTRWLFRGKVSQRLIYAAWLLVALRLLIPIQFGQSQYSVSTLTDTIEKQSVSIQQAQDAMDQPISGPTREELYEQLLNEYIQHSTQPVTPEVQEQIKAEAAEQITAPTTAEILTAVWIGGIAAMAVWFLLTNIRFLHRARKDAEVFPCEAPVRVRLSSHVSSPCLVGVFRPVIYLTPASVESPQSLNHILTHEITHLRHWDHIWSLVRCLCLCIYWFHPLVWVAAILSKRDCELACDESALKKLGDDERIAYGRTLLAIVTHANSPAYLFETATAMNDTKKQLKERVNFIVKKPRNLLIAVIFLLLVTAIAVGCTFTGSNLTEPTSSSPTPTEPNVTDPVVTDPAVTDPTVTDPTTPPVTSNPIVTPPSPPSAAEQAALDTAEALIADYRLYNAVGVVCDYELVVQDMSQHLTAAQKEAYWDRQYRIKCCDTATDVHAHIDSCLASSLLRRGYPDDILFTDGSDLYLIIVPTEMYVYTNVGVGQYSDSRIVASAGRFDEDGIYQTDIFTIEKANGQFRITEIKKLEASPNAADPDTVGLTMELAEKLLGMTYCEFLYTSNQIVLEHLNANELDETVKQQARGTIIWDAPAIRSRALYLNDQGTLMLYFRYGSLLADTDPLYGFYCTEFDLQKFGWKRPTDLKDVSYRWLFEMDDHVDGFTATGHDYLMLDSFFQEPDLFLAILAEYDTEAIRVLTLRMHSAISSQREYDLYTQLLLAISARTDLTAAEEQALVLLAEAVPGDFPYEVPPVAASPEPTGNLPENVQGADPELPNGVVTIPPANTLAHTHIYTTTTIKPTCAVKGYDYHLCRCGAYYCDDFKNTVEHKYEYDPDGVHQSPTFKETGCRSFICERCGDKYTEMLPCPADVDTEAIEEYAKNYAREKGFTVVDFIEEAPRKHFHSTIIPIYEPFMLVDNLEKHLKRRMGGLIYSAAQQVDRPRLEAEDYNIYIDVSLEGNFELCVRIEEKE